MSTFASLAPDLSTFFAPDTPEAQAHARVSDSGNPWDYSVSIGASLNEQLLSLAAAYLAVNRYIHGNDLYIRPKTTRDLENVLRRYSVDAIHDYISLAKTPLSPGGYSRASSMAQQSIQSVLASQSNAQRLLQLHGAPGATTTPNRDTNASDSGT